MKKEVIAALGDCMKNLMLILLVGGLMAACSGVQGKISADECGCPDNDRKTILITKQIGISGDECGCPENDRKTIDPENPIVMGD